MLVVSLLGVTHLFVSSPLSAQSESTGPFHLAHGSLRFVSCQCDGIGDQSRCGYGELYGRSAVHRIHQFNNDTLLCGGVFVRSDDGNRISGHQLPLNNSH